MVTLAIEVPVLFLLLRFVYKNKKLDLKKIIFIGMMASALTLPYLWFVLSPYILSNYYVYIGEIVVVLLEALVYNQFLDLKFGKSLFVSVVCNAVSFLIGLVVF